MRNVGGSTRKSPIFRSNVRLGKGAQVQPNPRRPALKKSRLTAAGRKKLSDLMRRRWAVKKKAAAK